MLALIDCFLALAVVLVAPHLAPESCVIGRDHATFTTRRHYLVLTERPGTDMSNTADRPAFVRSAMSLSTVLDDLKSELISQRHYRIHIAGPARQMHTDDCSRSRRDYSTDRFRGNVL